MGILNIDLNNINLDNTNYDEDDLILLFLSGFCLGISNLKNANNLKKISEELMPIAWYPKDGGIFACQKIREKK